MHYWAISTMPIIHAINGKFLTVQIWTAPRAQTFAPGQQKTLPKHASTILALH